ncbi:MAG TPA: SDR family oxidoreductase [Acidimicrobiales bacterium]|nr:SDR family oxidoreductase [Acidimicrobiales bacterium]
MDPQLTPPHQIGTLSAVVTGASKGFGLAVATVLAKEGWHVTVDGRHAGTLLPAASKIAALAVPGDVTDPGHRRQLVEAAVGAAGGIDLVVNNAGALGPSPLPSLAHCDMEDLRAVFEANVFAPLGLVQLALPYLRARRGAVLNVTSDAALEAYEGWGAYGSSKAALEQWSAVLAAEEPELAVWWLDPGDMRTDMHQAAFPGEDISDRPLAEHVAPCVASLAKERPPSGRYRASELLEAAR